MSATTNIREREYGDLYGKKHPYWAIASLSDLIGLCGYVILKWEQEHHPPISDQLLGDLHCAHLHIIYEYVSFICASKRVSFADHVHQLRK